MPEFNDTPMAKRYYRYQRWSYNVLAVSSVLFVADFCLILTINLLSSGKDWQFLEGTVFLPPATLFPFFYALVILNAVLKIKRTDLRKKAWKITELAAFLCLIFASVLVVTL
jgi:hypothetical protein